MYNNATLGFCLTVALAACGCTMETVTEENTDMAGLHGWGNAGDLVTGAGVSGGNSGVAIQAQLAQEDSVTTQFSLTGLDFSTGNRGNPQAEITSLVNGNQVRRLVSVINGASITTRGKNINVVVRDYTDPSISQGVTYQVAILATQGVRPSAPQPPLLFPLQFRTTIAGALQPITADFDMAPGDSIYIPVPQNAGVNQLFVAVQWNPGDPDPSDSSFQVIQSTDAAGPGTKMAGYSPFTYNNWVPMYPNVAQIEMKNSSASIHAFASLIFGVDG